MKYRCLLPFALALLSLGSASASDVRQHIRFDDNWKFELDPNPTIGGSMVANWQWTPAAAISDLNVDNPPESLSGATWRRARIGQDVFRNRPGFAWFRADLGSSLPVKGNGKRVAHFESVDDNCEVWVNGKFLIKHYVWDDPFDVPLDSVWHEGGSNTVVVLVQNTGGGGGLMGPVTLKAGDEEEIPEKAKSAYSESSWRTVHLPHDYLLEAPFTPTADASHGSLPQTPAWYRKRFDAPASWKGQSVWVQFDGVYRNSMVWINGHKLGYHTSGYIGFRHDLAPYLNYGGSNVIAVHVDPRQSEGWWYEGAGIYRHVWMNVAFPIHLTPGGTYAESTVTGDSANLTLSSEVANDMGPDKQGSVVYDIFDPSGHKVSSNRADIRIGAGETRLVVKPVTLSNIKLWSIEMPQLYTMKTSVLAAGKLVDQMTTTFGIRTIKFDAEKGFFLNGKPVKLKGTCNHQDFIGVGTGMPDSVLYWRIKKLKEMGSNAYRCSHNPPAPELLDACDRLGMVVMDETRHLGNATGPKTPHGTKIVGGFPELREMIRRDRNHPSIIIWSLANEEPLQGTEEGATIFKAMMDEVHQLDRTRPCSCAMNGGWGSGITLVEDLQGINYSPTSYDGFHKRFPQMPLFGSETASAVSTRGEYVNDRDKGYVSAYDVNAPPWAQPAQVAWKAIADRDFVAGGFVWTGFDYKGEPTPYGWPCVNSHFGIMDMCGFPKDSYYYYKAWWGDKPVVHVYPHWNWPGKEGQPIDVWVQSNCDEVELFLNGVSLGRKPAPPHEHLEWKVNYAPGTIEAKGYRAGKLITSDKVETTGEPARIVLKTDRTRLTDDDEDVTMVEVQVLDAKGRIVPYAANKVDFSIEGAGSIAGVGNGDASSHEPDQAPSRSAFHGLCMVLVRAKNSPGSITLRASSPGLKGASMAFTSGSAR